MLPFTKQHLRSTIQASLSLAHMGCSTCGFQPESKTKLIPHSTAPFSLPLVPKISASIQRGRAQHICWLECFHRSVFSFYQATHCLLSNKNQCIKWYLFIRLLGESTGSIWQACITHSRSQLGFIRSRSLHLRLVTSQKVDDYLFQLFIRCRL